MQIYASGKLACGISIWEVPRFTTLMALACAMYFRLHKRGVAWIRDEQPQQHLKQAAVVRTCHHLPEEVGRLCCSLCPATPIQKSMVADMHLTTATGPNATETEPSHRPGRTAYTPGRILVGCMILDWGSWCGNKKPWY